MSAELSDRGFKHWPSVWSRRGEEVRIYESSAAEEPHLWLAVYSGDQHGTAHLTLDQALIVADLLTAAVQNHYQFAPEIPERHGNLEAIPEDAERTLDELTRGSKPEPQWSRPCPTCDTAGCEDCEGGGWFYLDPARIRPMSDAPVTDAGTTVVEPNYYQESRCLASLLTKLRPYLVHAERCASRRVGADPCDCDLADLLTEMEPDPDRATT